VISKPRLAEAELVKLFVTKSILAAETLYDRYAEVLRLTIFRIVPVRNAAEEILQQTFLEIWNISDLFLQQKEKLITWMLQIARKLAHDYLIKADALALEV
jgi:DNA-directed RNA polymerase specialized sigma24 family protein